MRSALGAAIVLASVLVGSAQSPPSRASNAVTPLELEVLLSAVTFVDGDPLALEWTTSIARQSPTFRDMLGVLQRTPHMRVTLLSRADLRRLTGLPGRGTFTAANGRILGLLEFDRSRMEPLPQVRSIVHEMAHAVEIACLPPPEETADLRRQLTERESESTLLRNLIEGIETAFPNAVVRAVMAEHDAQSEVGKLRALAAGFGLNLPAAEAVADTSK